MDIKERKGFNFYKSYFDVYIELPDDDKLLFIDALLKKEFYGVDPKDLKGMANFAYISQKHSIDSQVKGYEDKTGTKLHTPTDGGRQGGSKGESSTPTLQEKGKGKEKVEYTKSDLENKFLSLFNKLKKERGMRSNVKTLSKTDKNNLKALRKNHDAKDFILAINNMFQSKWAQDNNMLLPSHLLRIDNFNKYLNMESKKELTLAEKLAGKQ